MKLKHQLLSLLGCATLMLASSCTDDALDNGANNGQSPEADSNVVTLTVLDGASQQGRIHTPAAPNTRALKSQRLQYVATIDNELWQADSHVWSATSVYIDDATKQAYVTWHSDRQANNPAQMWGGAMDVIDITHEDKPAVKTSLVSEKLLKFNNVMEYSSKLYLSAMHPRKGGVVARVDLNTPNQADLIGFPGSSVNAIALSDAKLMVVSGFKGTYGTVSPMQAPIEYDYDNPDNNAYLSLNQALDKDFGGKYVAVDEGGRAYILRQNGDKGEIIDVKGDNTIPMSVPLLSEEKYAEDYDPATGNWVTEGTRRSEYFGKHVMVIRKGYAYVAAGKSGIYKYNLTSGQETQINGIFATGLYADDEFLYAATGSGLRIYQFNDETGDLPLYAFEVETYDEAGNGAPTSTTAATTGASTTKRHSPNFVTAHHTDKGIYIYIAYGQSGVRVYKFVKEGEEQPGEPEDNHGWVDPGDDSDIVWATEDVEGYYAWGEIFHADSGDNTLYTFDADPEGLSFTQVINGEVITVTNNAEYWCDGNGSTSKTAYVWDNYRFFNGTTTSDETKEGYDVVKMTKYQLNADFSSEDGLLTLKPQDDVATMRWGNGWRMPTEEEWTYLITKLADFENSDLITEGENEGLLTLRFKNSDATLTFPRTGFYTYNGGSWQPGNADDGYHYYWSSTLSPKDHYRHPGHHVWWKYGKTNLGWSYEALAYMADFGYAPWAESNDHPRCQGFKVRPVKDKKNMPNDFPEWQDKQ